MKFPAGITAFLGKRGKGKSLHLAYYAYHRMIRGTPVYSNMPIEFFYRGKHYKANFIDNADEFLRVFYDKSNCLVIFDEAGTLLPKEKWRSLPMWVKKKFRESRKDRIDIYYSAQNIRQVVRDLVELTEEACFCTVKPLWGFVWWLPKLNPKGIRTYFKRHYYRSIPRLLRNLWKFKGTRDWPYHYRAWKNHLKYMRPLFIANTPAFSFKGYYSDPYNYLSQRQTYGKKWWESIWRTDYLRPRHWWRPAQAYDTRFKPDSHYKPKRAASETYKRGNPSNGNGNNLPKTNANYNSRETSPDAFHGMRN